MKLIVGKKYICRNRPDIKYVEIVHTHEHGKSPIQGVAYFEIDVSPVVWFFTEEGISNLHEYRDLVAEYKEEKIELHITDADIGRTVKLRDGRCGEIKSLNGGHIYNVVIKVDNKYIHNRDDGRYWDGHSDHKWDVIEFVDEIVKSDDTIMFITAASNVLQDEDVIAVREDGQIMYNFEGKLYWDIDPQCIVNEDYAVSLCNTNMLGQKFTIATKGNGTSPSGMFKLITKRIQV